MKTNLVKVISGLIAQSSMIGALYIGLPFLNKHFLPAFMLLFMAHISLQFLIYMLDAGITNYVLRELPILKISHRVKFISAIRTYYLFASFLSVIASISYFLFNMVTWGPYIASAFILSFSIGARFLSMFGRAQLLAMNRHFFTHTISSCFNVLRFILLPYIAIKFNLNEIEFSSYFLYLSMLEFVIYEFVARYTTKVKWNLTFDFKRIIFVLKESSSYLYLGLLSALIFQFDRLLIPYYFDSHTSLKYLYIYMLGFVVIYAVSPLNTAFIPSMCKLFQNDKKAYYKVFRLYAVLLISGVFIYLISIIFLSEYIMIIWMGENFFQKQDYYYLLLISFFMGAMSLSNVFYINSFVLRDFTFNKYLATILFLLMCLALVFSILTKDIFVYLISLVIFSIIYLCVFSLSQNGCQALKSIIWFK